MTYKGSPASNLWDRISSFSLSAFFFFLSYFFFFISLLCDFIRALQGSGFPKVRQRESRKYGFFYFFWGGWHLLCSRVSQVLSGHPLSSAPCSPGSPSKEHIPGTSLSLPPHGVSPSLWV